MPPDPYPGYYERKRGLFSQSVCSVVKSLVDTPVRFLERGALKLGDVDSARTRVIIFLIGQSIPLSFATSPSGESERERERLGGGGVEKKKRDVHSVNRRTLEC